MSQESEETALVEPSSRKLAIHDHGIRAWIPMLASPHHMSPYSQKWQVALDAIEFSEVDGPAEGLYLSWKLEDRKTTHIMWLNLLNKEAAHDVTNRYRNAVPNVVYVEKTNGYPLGRYMDAICGPRGTRAKGLAVQAYGHRNLNPCECCERRYLTSYVSFEDGENPQVHVMWPFFECISLKGFSNGVCGNCIYHLREGECTYNTSNGGGRLVAAMRAGRRSFVSLGPRRFNDINVDAVKIIDTKQYVVDIEAKQRAETSGQSQTRSRDSE